MFQILSSNRKRGPRAPRPQPASVHVSWEPYQDEDGSDVELLPESGIVPSQRICRVLDIAIALVALVFFAPLMIVIALLVRMSGPVLFGHARIGRSGRIFTCWKFRTMHIDADNILKEALASSPHMQAEWDRDRKLRSDPRVGRIGTLLRKSSLDELPQLFNVLNGTMSIVGPRPIVQAETWRYGRYFAAYCQVRPGITGLWQVSGRNGTTYRRRVACDVTYVRTKSPINDIRIMMRTIPAVFLARGAY